MTKQQQDPGYVYTLELRDGKWYVGHSKDLDYRIACHFDGEGAKWTKQHKPIRVVDVQPGDTMIEQLTTIAMMVQHGWQNVRGGPWCMVDMPAPPTPLVKLDNFKGKRLRTSQSDEQDEQAPDEQEPEEQEPDEQEPERQEIW